MFERPARENRAPRGESAKEERLRRVHAVARRARGAVKGGVLRLLLVCAGGALGSGARYLVSTWAARALGPDFPRGTLIVNVAGSFLLGFVFALPAPRISPEARLFVGAGLLGGFTTYSSFNTETIALLQQGSLTLAALNVSATVLGCFAAGIAGVALGRLVAG